MLSGMRILLTGSEGFIGRVLTATLSEAGFEVIRFDATLGQDVRDPDSVQGAMRGCQTAVHLAALTQPAPELGAVNVLGTWNVLQAAASAGVERVICMSSVNALGILMGERHPDYLPIDDQHPSYAGRPYSLSKWLAEEMCAGFSRETGLATVCLRPPAVWDDAKRERVLAERAADPEREWTPFWEYGAYLDVRDLADAVARSIAAPLSGHHRMLLCSDRISATAPGRELARRLLPRTAWRGGRAYQEDPMRSLVAASLAKRLLGWSPGR